MVPSALSSLIVCTTFSKRRPRPRRRSLTRFFDCFLPMSTTSRGCSVVGAARGADFPLGLVIDVVLMASRFQVHAARRAFHAFRSDFHMLRVRSVSQPSRRLKLDLEFRQRSSLAYTARALRTVRSARSK